MKRRTFLAGAAALSTLSLPALGAVSCFDGPYGRDCTAEIDFQQFAEEAFEQQTLSQWCWAASISMLFRYYGFSVSQPRIVKETYGSVVDMPAGAGFIIARQVNRDWRDDRGRRFKARLTAAYDHDAGFNNLNNSQLIRELREDRPVLIGARTHAMVMTAMRYIETPMGPNVGGVGVFDPFPGVGARGLAMDEMRPIAFGGSLRFAATVRVTS